MKIQFAGPRQTFCFRFKIFKKIWDLMYTTCPNCSKIHDLLYSINFSAQKAGNRILGHWCTSKVPSRRRGVKAFFWYSRLHFSNLLATSIFIETPGSLQEIATLAIIPEISDSNLETGRYSSKSGVSLIISVELTALVLVYHVSGGTEHIYLNKVPLGAPKTWGVLDKVWEALPLGPTPYPLMYSFWH